MIAPENYLVLSGLLLLIGAYGVLTQRNAIVVLMSIEIMLTAANINLVAFAGVHHALSGQVFALFVVALAGAEVAIGIAIMLALHQRRGTIQLDALKLLRW